MKLIVEENPGWDPDIRAENCFDLPNALREIVRMIEDGFYSGLDCPMGWDWELHE